MIKHFQLLGLFTVWAFLYATTGFAQEDESALPPATEIDETKPEAPAGQEVEINEDNYRQFMELKDPLQQRTILPENSYQSQAGLQKLDKLPEESQKHLRNQLREVIVQGDQWQPGDEDGDYPYIPSEAASTDGALQKQEAEAWGELVDHYHAREGDIYANAPRTSAAAAAGGSFSDGSGDGKESTGGSEGQGDAGEQAGQKSSSDQSSTAGGYSPDSANDPGENSTEGVSQNAMEFLMKSGNLGVDAGNNSVGPPGGSDGQPGAQEQASQQQAAQAQSGQEQSGQEQSAQGQASQEQSAQAQATQEQSAQAQAAQDQAEQEQSSQDQVTQQADAEQAQTLSATDVQIPADESIKESTAGTSQNALEYLTGKGVQNEDAPGDTLTIEDLVNAQGVSVQIGVGSSDGNKSNEEEPDENTPKKDGGG